MSGRQVIKFNKKVAVQLVRLCDYCFKMGVIEACELEDDYAAKEWMDTKLEDESFGLLSDIGVDYDWRRWRFALFRWSRNANLTFVGENFIDMIRTKTQFYFVALPIMMRFYLMGIGEWLDYPNRSHLTIFKKSPRAHWKPVAKHLKEMRVDDFISYIQEFVYQHEAKETVKKAESNYFASSPTIRQYQSFSMAMWQMTRRFPEYEEYRDNESETEEVESEA